MPVGGNGNNGLQQLGEEEEKLQQEKKLNEDYTVDINTDNEKVVGPAVTLCDSSSLATAPLSIDPVNKTAADSDTGSEDSRINSDRESLLVESNNY